MTVGDVLDGAFRLLRANWRTMLVVTAIVVIPVQLVTSWFARDLLSGGFLQLLEDPFAAQDVDPGSWLGDLANLAYALVLLPLLTGGLAWVAVRSALGDGPGWRETLRVIVRRGVPLVAAWWLFLGAFAVAVAVGAAVMAAGVVAQAPVLLVLGVLALFGGILAGLALGAWFALAPSAVVVEDAGPLRALRRSARLVRGRFWPVLGTLVLAGLVTSVVSFALSGVPSMVGMFLADYGWVLAAGGSIVGSLVTVPVFAVVLALLYLDVRIRHEGLDLEIAAARSNASPGRSRPW
jgi:hypothetical protein